MASERASGRDSASSPLSHGSDAYTASELMVCAAARTLGNGQVVFVGIGLPNQACNLARRLHAPDLVLVYESGAVGAVPDRLPVSIGDPSLVTGSLAVVPMTDIFWNLLQGGHIDVGFLQGAEIDRHGNLNTTVIGDYRSPEVRLPGSGGACEIAILARQVVVIMPQTRRSFRERVGFVTSPGHLDGGDARARLGYPGAGPTRVITDLGTYRFVDGEMELLTLHPGVELATVRAATGWELRVAEPLGVTPPPSAGELAALRALGAG
jgi:glutaconate CoA-transferase subunit B